MSEAVKCTYTLENGLQCGSFARSGKALCINHDPESREEKIEAVTKGGKSNKIKISKPLLPIAIKSSQDVVTVLCQIISEVRSGEIDPKIASTLGFLCNVTIKAYEVAEGMRRQAKSEATYGIMPPKNYS